MDMNGSLIVDSQNRIRSCAVACLRLEKVHVVKLTVRINIKAYKKVYHCMHHISTGKHTTDTHRSHATVINS